MMTLRTMERLGLITRSRDEMDKRRISILLTPRARDMEEELLGVAAEINRAMLATISQDTRVSMVSSLRSVHTELARACDGVLQPIGEEIAGDLTVPAGSSAATARARKRALE